MTIDRSKPVMVTGATSYVGGPLVDKLLAAGLTVHAPIRNPDNKDKTKYLDQLAADRPGQLRYFAADLLEAGSYREAMMGCQLVFHTASPFTMRVDDPQRDLVDPALQGTRNVLQTVNEVETVERVVLTSSVAAMYGDNIDLEGLPGQMITEEVWNHTSSLDHQPYNYSKTVAEKEAWKIHDNQNRWQLVVINPALVIGPGLNPWGTSESFRVIKQLGDGTAARGVPDFEIGVVDVREVAEAHVKAGFLPEAHGRHILCARSVSLLELGTMLRNAFGSRFPFPQKTVPKPIVWLVAPFLGVTRAVVKKSFGYPFRGDHTKSVEQLGIQYRPVEDSVVEFFQQMIDAGAVKPKA
jgi:dihydroflavonol-4-reductase